MESTKPCLCFTKVFCMLLYLLMATSGNPINQRSPSIDIEAINQKLGLEDDVIEHKRRTRRDTVGNNVKVLWKNGDIPYVFENFSFSQKQLIKFAMFEIESFSCMRFVDFTHRYRGDLPGDYLHIQGGNTTKGCSSFIGRNGGRQQLSLFHDSANLTCLTKKIIQHELLHAIGFYHEHRRDDRDKFVTIQYENIIPGKEHNFKKLRRSEPFGISYDAFSIMHYDNQDFSKNGKPTIVWNSDERVPVGGPLMTEKDIQQLTSMYRSVCSPNKPFPTPPLYFSIVMKECSKEFEEYFSFCPEECNGCRQIKAERSPTCA